MKSNFHWAFAHGTPCAYGIVRAVPADFQVTEQLGFDLEGVGEHVYLYIQKIGENTEWIASQLAKFTQARKQDIGYAGLKDRHAITRQWFSIRLPLGQTVDWTLLNSDRLSVLAVNRHRRKLKRGALRVNQFQIRIRQLHCKDQQRLVQQCTAVRQFGVPNYFGDQRFGRQAANLVDAQHYLSGHRRKLTRHQRSLLLSAARSWLFNQILSARVSDHTWNLAQLGDVLCLNGSNSFFVHDGSDGTVSERVDNLALHPTGPLWGKGDLPSQQAIRALEQTVVAGNAVLADGLARAGVAQARRALRLAVSDFQWSFPAKDEFLLTFALPAGGYATAVLRELIIASNE